MPYTTQWLVENRVVRTHVFGKLTEAEAQEMSAAHASFIEKGTRPVHLIVEVAGLESIPISLRQNTAMGGYLRHPSLGWIVLVGGSMLVNFTISVLSQVFHMRQARRETIPEALTFLATQDDTLNIEDQPPAAV